jgi:penicillin-binding protein-related factor A (putative recombinase)
MTPAEQLAALTRNSRQRGRARNGNEVEATVDQLNAWCLAAGVAYIHKVATPYLVVRNNPDGTFTARRVKKPGCDYAGVFLDGSKRRVVVEAKGVEAPDGRFCLSKIRESQRAQLEAYAARGEGAVLLVVRGPAHEAFAVPWTVARTLVSLGDAELAPWRVGHATPYLARWATGTATRR